MPRNTQDAQVDVLSQMNNQTTGGDVAMQLLASEFNPALLRSNSILREDEWRQYDKEVIDVTRKRLHAAQDLIAAGLEYNLPNAMGVMELRWDTVSDLTDAEVSMAAVTQAQNDRQRFSQETMPIPIVHKAFELNTRHLAAARNNGRPMDTAHVSAATRKVAEKTDDIIFNGTTAQGRSGSVVGYRNAPNRVTGSLTATWLTATGAQILTDTLAIINAGKDDYYYGPWMVYVSEKVMTHLGEDYKSESDKTIKDRLMEVEGVSQIKSSPNLPDGEVIFVLMERDTVELVNGLEPTVVSWGTQGGFVMNFRVISIMLPRIRSTYEDTCGILHYSA